jgi:hypothetical protein
MCILSSIALAMPLGQWEYTGNYAILRQDGFEANYDIDMISVGKSVEICVISKQDSYPDLELSDFERGEIIYKNIPESLPIYEKQIVKKLIEKPVYDLDGKQEEDGEGKLLTELVLEDVYEYVKIKEQVFFTDKDVKKSCYTATPHLTPYLKIGDNSIELYAEQVFVANVTGTNVTIEPDYAHLSLADPSIVAYYPLNNVRYGTVNITDDWGDNNNDGNLTGYTFNPGTRVNGQSGSYFNGSQFINSTINLNFSNSFTINVWANPNNILGTGVNNIFRLTNNSPSATYPYLIIFVRNSSNNPRYGYRLQLNSSYLPEINTAISDDILQNLVMLTAIYNGSALLLYQNNIYIDKSTLSLSAIEELRNVNINNAFGIGANHRNSDYFNGTIDSTLIFNKALNSSEISAIYNAGKCAVSPIGDRLVAQYILCNQSEMNAESLPYSETQFSNSTTVYDTNNMVEGRSGKGSVAYNFNGVNDKVEIKQNNILNFSTSNKNITISGWIKSRGITGTIIGTTDNVIILDVSGSSVRFILNTLTNDRVTYDVTGNHLYLWKFYTGTYNGSDLRLYVDGVLVNTTVNTGGLYNTSNNFEISNNPSRANGSISDVMIFNRSLSSTEVAQLYAGTFPLYKKQGYLNNTQVYLEQDNILNLINVTVSKSYRDLYLKSGIGNKVLFEEDKVSNYPVIYSTLTEQVYLLFESNSYNSLSPILYNSYDISNYTCYLNLSEGQHGNTCPITITSTTTSKIINNGLADSINTSIYLNYPCGVRTKGYIESLSYNGFPHDYDCINNKVVLTNKEVSTGISTITAKYYDCLGMSAGEVSLIAILLILCAMGVFTFFTQPDIMLKIGSIIVFIVGTLIFILVVSAQLSTVIC